MASERAERAYRLEPLDTSGVFLGLGIVQCLLLGGGITLAVLAITAGVPVPVAAFPSSWPQRSPASLGPVATPCGSGSRSLAGWTWAGLRRGRRWDAPLPLWPTDDSTAPMPPCLEGLDIIDIDWRAGHQPRGRP
ncbi:MAG: hypothetical protein V9E99_05310 [Microthrixaceae bacterium]